MIELRPVLRIRVFWVGSGSIPFLMKGRIESWSGKTPGPTDNIFDSLKVWRLKKEKIAILSVCRTIFCIIYNAEYREAGSRTWINLFVGIQLAPVSPNSSLYHGYLIRWFFNKGCAPMWNVLVTSWYIILFTPEQIRTGEILSKLNTFGAQTLVRNHLIL